MQTGTHPFYPHRDEIALVIIDLQDNMMRTR
jgi:hypothetical protein